MIRPMMYLALSYDHRVVDGQEAVTFLVRVKEASKTRSGCCSIVVSGDSAWRCCACRRLVTA